jgi:hypothetical protein
MIKQKRIKLDWIDYMVMFGIIVITLFYIVKVDNLRKENSALREELLNINGNWTIKYHCVFDLGSVIREDYETFTYLNYTEYQRELQRNINYPLKECVILK